MDEKDLEQTPEQTGEEAPAEEEKKVYVPRPAWQVWGARVALVLFILMLILYYVNLLRGGF